MPERLADLTTLRLGGPARELVRATTEDDLLAAVRTADAAGTPLLLVAGGSNLVVADGGFDGTVVQVGTRGVSVEQDTCGGAVVTVAAGESWDGFVERAVQEGWVGVEALSGIPGSVGATPIQNVGAYGQEVAETIASVRCWDRVLRGQRTFFATDCRFGYRTSRFKQDPDRHVVLSVTFQLPARHPVRSRPLRRAGPDARRGRGRPRSDAGGPRGRARAAARQGHGARRGRPRHLERGLVLHEPVRRRRIDVPEGAPRWPQPDGSVKTSAAWLIEHAGFTKGYGSGRAALSGKHTLALTNRGGARTEDLLALAAEIQRGVHDAFGVWLVNEPMLVGCELPAPAA